VLIEPLVIPEKRGVDVTLANVLEKLSLEQEDNESAEQNEENHIKYDETIKNNLDNRLNSKLF
jgi:hypothetical protein